MATMVYKALLIGKNTPIIDVFFDRLREDFLPLSSSMRYEDMNAHLDYFGPDVIVYCTYNETDAEVKALLELRRRLSVELIPLVIIGSRDDCDNFQRSAAYMANVVLTKPLTAQDIRSEIVNYMQALGGSTKEKRIEREREKAKEELRQKAAMRGVKERLANAGREQDADWDEEAEEAPASAPKIEQKDPGRRRHILVIDDDAMMLKMIKEHLKDQYDVATAISGKIAYKFLENKSTDLILLDYEMPEENGPMVLEHIRVMGGHEDTPVIFLTGVTEREKITEALKLKPQGYILKPIDRKKLLDTVANFTS